MLVKNSSIISSNMKLMALYSSVSMNKYNLVVGERLSVLIVIITLSSKIKLYCLFGQVANAFLKLLL